MNTQKTSRIPKLRHHKATGQAYVVLNGKAIYFGPFGTDEATEKYHQTIIEWMAAGKQLDQPLDGITINEIIARFWEHAQTYYVRPNGTPTWEINIGLLISTVSQTQQQAMMSTFFFYFPAVLLSGFMFPIANMPEVIQWFTFLNPLRYFLVIVRGIFLKGVGPETLWPQMVALAVMGRVFLWFASKRFKKTIA